MELVYSGKVAGVTFEPARSGILKAARSGKPTCVILTHNPNNPHDSNAIEVRFDDTFVGHIPATFCRKILDIGIDRVTAQFERWNSLDGGRTVSGAMIEVFKA